MSKFKLIGMLMLVFSILTACNDDDEIITDTGGTGEEGEVLPPPPGPDYVPQGKYNNNLNVVYYIPTDSDTVPDWHRRLSGVVLYIQDYYRQQMKNYGLGEKTFNLVINKQSPAYVKINYVKSEKISSAECMDPARGTSLAKQDLVNWFAAHPEEKVGNHFFVMMPGESASFFHGSYANWIDGTPLGMCFTACDYLGFSAWNYSQGKLSVGEIGGLMHELGHAFFLQHNSQKAGQAPQVALMNSGNWAYYPGNEQNVPLTLLDVMWLNEIQPFNDVENNYTKTPAYSGLKTRLSSDKDNIYVTVNFDSEDEVAGVGFYNDPWHNSDQKGKDADPYQYTEYDAVSYFVGANEKFSDQGSFVRNENSYEVSVVMPWKDLEARYKVPYADYKNVKAEIRFRVLFKGGLTIPAAADGPKVRTPRYYYQVHNENPDVVARYLDRSAWTATATTDGAEKLLDGTVADWRGMINSSVVIDMQQARKIRALFFQPGDNMTFRTTCVKVEGSLDGENYTELLPKYYMTDDNIESYEALLPGGDAEVRYLRMTLLKGKNSMMATFDEVSVFPAY